jgi:hypothetical protein
VLSAQNHKRPVLAVLDTVETVDGYQRHHVNTLQERRAPDGEVELPVRLRPFFDGDAFCRLLED